MNKKYEIQAANSEQVINSLSEWKAYLNSFKTSKNAVDVEHAKEIIEAFQEVDRNRSSSKKGAVVDKVKYPSNPTVFRAVVLDSHS